MFKLLVKSSLHTGDLTHDEYQEILQIREREGLAEAIKKLSNKLLGE